MGPSRQRTRSRNESRQPNLGFAVARGVSDARDPLFEALFREGEAARDWTTDREVWTVSQIVDAMCAAGQNVGASTVRGWCEDRLLVATKTSVRGHYRVKATDLRVFLNGHPEALAA